MLAFDLPHSCIFPSCGCRYVVPIPFSPATRVRYLVFIKIPDLSISHIIILADDICIEAWILSDTRARREAESINLGFILMVWEQSVGLQIHTITFGVCICLMTPQSYKSIVTRLGRSVPFYFGQPE